MIRLTEYSNKDNFVGDYTKDKFQKIQTKIKKMNPRKKEYLKELFPEAFLGDDLDYRFFEDLLSKNLYEVIARYPSVKEYYEIAFFASLDIQNICRGKDKKEATDIRKKYYMQTFLKGSEKTKRIFQDYRRMHPYIKDIEGNIYQDEEWFVEFRDYVKEKVLDSTRMRKDRLRYGVLREIFSYKTMIGKADRYNIVKNLQVEVCPYCNRAYVSCFEDEWAEDKRRTFADIDHFFSQSYFVLFSLSLYNFIPSCKICNSLFKGDKNMDILYPYTDAYDTEMKFVLIDNEKILEAKDVYGWSKGKEIDIKSIAKQESSRAEQIEREIQLFRIKEVYQVHNELAERLLYLKNVFGERGKAEILKCINQGLREEEKVKETDFNHLFYGVDLNKISYETNRVPLAKLIHDIVK